MLTVTLYYSGDTLRLGYTTQGGRGNNYALEIILLNNCAIKRETRKEKCEVVLHVLDVLTFWNHSV